MIVDATCAPSNIRYPQDVSQLNEARENAETLLDVLHDPADGKKPRTYRKRTRKDYLKYTRCRKHTAKMTRKAIGKQLTYLRRDLNAIDGKLSLGKNLPPRQTERLDTIRAVYEQQKYMYDNRTHSRKIGHLFSGHYLRCLFSKIYWDGKACPVFPLELVGCLTLLIPG